MVEVKKEECCSEFRQELVGKSYQITGKVRLQRCRKLPRRCLVYPLDRRRDNKQTWWWDEKRSKGLERRG